MDKRSFVELREILNKCFSPDTSNDGKDGLALSHGHCALVSILIKELYGGKHVSAVIDGVSHWFNLTEAGLWVDLTADQFGLDAVICTRQPPYENYRFRDEQDINQSTISRYEIFKSRYDLIKSNS